MDAIKYMCGDGPSCSINQRRATNRRQHQAITTKTNLDAVAYVVPQPGQLLEVIRAEAPAARLTGGLTGRERGRCFSHPGQLLRPHGVRPQQGHKRAGDAVPAGGQTRATGDAGAAVAHDYALLDARHSGDVTPDVHDARRAGADAESGADGLEVGGE
jgi:hypothetical protein